jgi:hypothetical protein
VCASTEQLILKKKSLKLWENPFRKKKIRKEKQVSGQKHSGCAAIYEKINKRIKPFFKFLHAWICGSTETSN